MLPTIYLKQFGCPTMRVFAEELADELSHRGFRILDTSENGVLSLEDNVESIKLANVCIFYMCGIVEFCEREIFNFIKSIRITNKKADIIITGCNFDKYKNPGYRFNLVTGEPEEIKEYIFRKYDSIAEYSTGKNKILNTKSIIVKSNCNKFCSYCIEPFLRGGSTYLNIYNSYSNIISSAKEAEKAGFKSVRLTGLCIGDWKDKKSGKGILDLMLGVLNHTSLSIRDLEFHPNDLTPAVIELLSNPRIGKQLSIPVQSGSDRILSAMNRGYTIYHVNKIIRSIYNKVPEVKITTDIIVGFPGETNADFKLTCNFVVSYPFERIYIMRFNSRPGTMAAGMKNQTPCIIKRKRIKLISDELNKNSVNFIIRDAKKRP